MSPVAENNGVDLHEIDSLDSGLRVLINIT